MLVEEFSFWKENNFIDLKFQSSNTLIERQVQLLNIMDDETKAKLIT